MDGTHAPGNAIAGQLIIEFMENEELIKHPTSFRVPYGVALDIVNSYKDGETPENPCRCTSKCDDACKGQCGCKRCHDDYMDFLSGE